MSQIFVREDQHHYIVNISYAQRERAKGIKGRLWDGLRKVWVFEKTEETYNSLVTEFKEDAKVFQIARPSRQSLERRVTAEDDASVLEEYEHSGSRLSSSNNDFIEKTIFVATGRLAEEGQMTRALLAQVVEKIDQLSAQGDEIRRKVNSSKAVQTVVNRPKRTVVKVEALPERSNIEDSAQLKFVELWLKEMALDVAGGRESLKLFLEEVQPLSFPREFISRSHLKVEEHLRGITDTPPREGTFNELIKTAREARVFFDHASTLQALQTLNLTRNLVVHNEISGYALLGRAAIYLLQLGFVWQAIVIE